MENSIEQILKLQSESSGLQPDKAEFNQLLKALDPLLESIFKENEQQNAWNSYPADATFNPSPIQKHGQALEPILQELVSLLKPGLNPASGGHLAYIPGGGIPMGAIGDFIAALNNRYVGVNSVCPGGVEIENAIIRWIAEIIGYNPDLAGGSLTSGGSIANLTAIVAARDASGHPPAIFPKLAVFMTRQVHHCVHKSLRIAGMDARAQEEGGQIFYIATDAEFRMSATHLKNAITQAKNMGFIPWLLVGSGGTTNTGAVDPIRVIGAIARENQIWFHLDAAYGAFFILTKHGKSLFEGIEYADSTVLDPHKTLFLSYGIGTVILKDKAHLLNSFFYRADYLPEEEYAQSNISPELTKHFRALRLWLPIKYYGLAPFIAALDEKILLAKYAYEALSKLTYIEMIAKPQLSVFAFRISIHHSDKPLNLNEINFRFTEYVKKNGKVFISGTNLQFNGGNCYALRLAIVSFRTHLEHIEHFLKVLHDFVLSEGLTKP